MLPYGYSYKASCARPSYAKFGHPSGHSHAQDWVSECQDVKSYKWRFNPVWHMIFLYSCSRMATVGVNKSSNCLSDISNQYLTCSGRVLNRASADIHSAYITHIQLGLITPCWRVKVTQETGTGLGRVWSSLTSWSVTRMDHKRTPTDHTRYLTRRRSTYMPSWTREISSGLSTTLALRQNTSSSASFVSWVFAVEFNPLTPPVAIQVYSY